MSPYWKIEWADFGNTANRIVVAAESLNDWCTRRQNELAERVCSLRLAIARELDAGKRAELAKELKQTEKDICNFNEGIRNSSLIRAVGARGRELSIAPAAEQRIMPISAPSAVDNGIESQPTSARAKLNGLGAVYNSRAEIGNYFAEIIMPGSFTEIIKTCDCRALHNHNPDLILGRTASRSLRLYDSHIGLIYWCDLLSNDQLVESLVKRIQRRDITGCSFSFIVGQDRWILAKKLGDLDLRIIERIDELYDVGPVTFPAYSDTIVQVVYERKKQEPDKYDLMAEADENFADADEILDRESERDRRFLNISERLRTKRVEDLRKRLRA